jgi:hypothetical protein
MKLAKSEKCLCCKLDREICELPTSLIISQLHFYHYSTPPFSLPSPSSSTILPLPFSPLTQDILDSGSNYLSYQGTPYDHNVSHWIGSWGSIRRTGTWSGLFFQYLRMTWTTSRIPNPRASPGQPCSTQEYSINQVVFIEMTPKDPVPGRIWTASREKRRRYLPACLRFFMRDLHIRPHGPVWPSCPVCAIWSRFWICYSIRRITTPHIV